MPTVKGHRRKGIYVNSYNRKYPSVKYSHPHMGENIPGGLASGKQPYEFDYRQLLLGTQVEMEHTGDSEVAKEIAMDHLVEDPDYYKKLKRMEEGKCDTFDIEKFKSQMKNFKDLVKADTVEFEDNEKTFDIMFEYKDCRYDYDTDASEYDDYPIRVGRKKLYAYMDENYPNLEYDSLISEKGWWGITIKKDKSNNDKGFALPKSTHWTLLGQEGDD